MYHFIFIYNFYYYIHYVVLLRNSAKNRPPDYRPIEYKKKIAINR